MHRHHHLHPARRPAARTAAAVGLVVIHAMAAATSLHAQEFCPARFTALPPVTLVSGESVHVDTPQPALGPSGLLLIGRETTVWRSADPDAPSLLLPDSVAGLVSSGPGRPWRLFPRPPGAAELIYPAVVTNGRVLISVSGKNALFLSQYPQISIIPSPS